YNDGDRRWLMELFEIMVDYLIYLSEDQIKKLIEISDQCISYHEKKGNIHLAQSWLELKGTIYSNLKNEDDWKETKREVAKLFEKQAESQSDSNLTRAKFLDEAMKIYAEIGDKDKKDELKHTISEIDTTKELKQIGTEIKIDFKEFDKHIDSLIEKMEGDGILYITGKDPSYLPSLEETKKFIAQLKKEHPLQYIFPTVIVDDYGNKIEISEEKMDDYKIKEHTIFSSSINQIYISRLLDKLVASKKLNNEMFERFLINCHFPSDSIKILKEAYLNYSEKRYASAISLIIPQIEFFIRFIYHYCKIPIFSIREFGHQTTILSSLLSHVKANEILGEDFTFYMKCYLVDPESANYRNKNCHGNLSYNSYTKELCDSMWYIIIKLGAIFHDLINKDIAEKKDKA
ncbi:MAG: DUF4209 domain-containing protein, partial [Promethearchaeota archaeon]